MANPLFNQMNAGNVANPLFERIARLKQQMGGDPNQHIQNLLNSGKVTQDQYNRAVQQAQKLKSMLGR
jgi:transcription initiation factor IIF auxiliary subunit